MPKFSIVIPVYNVASYLRECLDSVLSQTFTDWEVICVDDGSTDGSGVIIDEYVAKDCRFRAIHQKNSGVSCARNAGIVAARGEWVGFVDSDDYYCDEHLLEQILSVATDNPDVEIIGYNPLNDWGSSFHISPVDGVLSGDVFKGIVASKSFRQMMWSAVDKFYRRELLIRNAVRFPPAVVCAEDSLFADMALACAGKFIAKKEITGYVYRHHGGSLSSVRKFEKKMSQLSGYAFTIGWEHAHGKSLAFRRWLADEAGLHVFQCCAGINLNLHSDIARVLKKEEFVKIVFPYSCRYASLRIRMFSLAMLSLPVWLSVCLIIAVLRRNDVGRRLMDKIVFVTWGGGYNFGGCFQSYALLRKLQDLGYDVLHLTGIRFAATVKDRIKQLIKRSTAYRIFARIRRSDSIIDRKIRKWFDAYPSLFICTKAEMRRLLRETDCFVSGSDQIWNTYHHYSPFFFLDFAKGRKRISYASSIGTSDVNPRYATAVRALLDGFSHISVREQSGVRAITKLTGRNDIVQVLDPSFLLTRKEWSSVGEDAELEFEMPKRYILCYVLGRNPNYATWLNRVRAQTGISDVIVLPAKYDHPDFAPSGCFVYRNAGPREFIKLLENAALVVTDSFHATAFSLNFQKPFVEFLRFSDGQAESQNSRIYDLLDAFALRHRIYRGGSEVLDRVLEGWRAELERVQELLVKERMRCQNWLVDAIEH